jgi:hypothetical protein
LSDEAFNAGAEIEETKLFTLHQFNVFGANLL